MRPQSPSEVKALLHRHGLRPRKGLGQHFLADPNIVDKIVELAAIRPDDQVVEVGAGTGALTTALTATGATVVAYEVDTALAPILEEVLDGGTDVDLRFDDATTVDLDADLPAGPWVMVANLPYNVGTSIVLDVLRFVPRVTRMVIMVQEEVADRLAAAPGSKTYGLPSVVCQLHADVKIRHRVPPQVFVPPPGVGSAVVRIDRHPAPPGVERAIALAAAAFGQRRKMLRGSLRAAVPDPGGLLAAAGIDETLRAEDLTPDDYVRLAGTDT